MSNEQVLLNSMFKLLRALCNGHRKHYFDKMCFLTSLALYYVFRLYFKHKSLNQTNLFSTIGDDDRTIGICLKETVLDGFWQRSYY